MFARSLLLLIAVRVRSRHATRRSEGLMHPSLQWTTFTGDVLSREEYIAGNTGGALRWRSQRLEDTCVVVVGDTAVLTALVTDEVERDGREQAFTLRLTQTWVRTEGAWQCLAGHAGPDLDRPARTMH